MSDTYEITPGSTVYTDEGVRLEVFATPSGVTVLADRRNEALGTWAGYVLRGEIGTELVLESATGEATSLQVGRIENVLRFIKR